MILSLTMNSIIFKGNITHRRVQNLVKKVLEELSQENTTTLIIKETNGDMSILLNFLFSVRKTYIDRVRDIKIQIEDERIKRFIEDNQLESLIYG